MHHLILAAALQNFEIYTLYRHAFEKGLLKWAVARLISLNFSIAIYWMLG